MGSLIRDLRARWAARRRRALPGAALCELPAAANNVSNCNSVPFTQDSLVTDGATQYAVWVSGRERRPLLAHRTLPEGAWSQPFDLGAVSGNPLHAPTAHDPHNSHAIAIDALGHVHVAGNHHNDPLRYARSGRPHDPGSLARGLMVGDEESVTYPTFVRIPDGTLLFLFRSGRAGNGDLVLNRLAAGETAWRRVGVLIDGRATDESPYWNHVAVSRAGVVHLSGCFRARGGAAHNRDVWHVQSHDGGETWTDAAGRALTPPLTHATVPLAHRTAAVGSGLVNQCGMDVDALERPHIALLGYDDAGATQIRHLWRDAGEWRLESVTDFTHRLDTDVPIVSAEISRPAIACAADGRTWLIFRAGVEGRGGTVRCLDVTPERRAGGREVVLLDRDLGSWEPSYDTRALRERDELHMLVTAAPPYDAVGEERDGLDWAAQPIAVLSLRAGPLALARARATV